MIPYLLCNLVSMAVTASDTSLITVSLSMSAVLTRLLL